MTDSRPAPYVPTLPTDPEATMDVALGRRLAEAAVGMDRMERRLNGGEGPLDTEGLVPIWLGDGIVDVPELEGWQEAEARLEALATDCAALSDGPRRDFLTAMVESLLTAAKLFQGHEMSYGEKLERLVRVPNEPVHADVLAMLRDGLDEGLARAGIRSGSLPVRVRRWEQERGIDADRLPSVFEELMDEARARTDAQVYAVGDYDMDLNPVSGVPYSARCNFAQGKMDLNVDLGFSRAALKHLVAHEVFPGHSTQLLYTRDAAVAGTATPDVLLCTVNGATGAVQEGIGDQGAQLIDWVEDPDDSVHLFLRRLRSAGQATAAWHHMEGGWDADQTRTWLRDEACGQPAWVEGRLRFSEHPFRGPFIASYWYGDEAVREVRERTTAGDRDEFIAFLYGRMNTPMSLRRFAPSGQGA